MAAIGFIPIEPIPPKKKHSHMFKTKKKKWNFHEWGSFMWLEKIMTKGDI